MRRECEACGKPFDAASKRIRFCKRDACLRARARDRKRKQLGQVTSLPQDSSLSTAVRAELTEAGQTESAIGQQAIHLASQLDAGGHHGSAVASLHKELRATMQAAVSAQEHQSPVDELRQKRLQRLGAGA